MYLSVSSLSSAFCFWLLSGGYAPCAVAAQILSSTEGTLPACLQLRPQNQPHLRNAWGVPTFIGEQVAVAASSIKAAAGNQLWSLAWIPSCQNGEQGESTNSRVRFFNQQQQLLRQDGAHNLPVLSLARKLQCRSTFFFSPQINRRPDVEPKTND